MLLSTDDIREVRVLALDARCRSLSHGGETMTICFLSLDITFLIVSTSIKYVQ